MSDLRDNFTITGGGFNGTSVIKETGGTNNTNGSNSDNTNWDTTQSFPWNTVIDKYSWEITGHSTHKILFDPARPCGTQDGWMYLDAIGGGWTPSETNGVIKFTRDSDGWYIQWNAADAWVSGSPPSLPSTNLQTFTLHGVSNATVIQKLTNNAYHSWPCFTWNTTDAWVHTNLEWEIEKGTGANAGQYRWNHDHSSHGDTTLGAWATPDSTTGIVTLTNTAGSSHAIAEIYCKPPSSSGGGGGFLADSSDDDEPPRKVFRNFW